MSIAAEILKIRAEFESKFDKIPKDLYVNKPVFDAILDEFSKNIPMRGIKGFEFLGMKTWLVDSETPIRVR